MKEFYTKFYATVEDSAAHHTFCERAFGKDLCQHGFADMAQLDLVVEKTGLRTGQHLLDLGCGNGMISEYFSERTGAHVTGLDYIAEAIYRARRRAAAKPERLEFRVGDINQLDLPPAAYDLVLSIDTVYFSEDYGLTIRALKAALRPGGQMAFLYSHGREPGTRPEDFPKETLRPDRTPLAQALTANGLSFRAEDLTRRDYELALRRTEALLTLKAQFEADGALFIYENRLAEAQGIAQAIADGLHARYFYCATLFAAHGA